MVGVIGDMGKPFMEESGDLLALDSKNLADASVIQTVRTEEKLGQDQYQSFINKHLKTRNKSVFQLATLKDECSLFSKLYISCQVRESNHDAFFHKWAISSRFVR